MTLTFPREKALEEENEQVYERIQKEEQCLRYNKRNADM
jgi:hypothetical protein